jgi:hypothetical protein
MTDTPHTGGCQCGAVRFRAAALGDNPHVCYCRMCQKAVGNLFAALVGVRGADLTWTRGMPATFRSSVHVERGFCRDCGTPLFYRYESADGGASLCIGAFDEPQRIVIRYQMGMEGKHPSLTHLDAIEQTGTTESAMADEVEEIRLTSRQHPDHDTSVWPPESRS